MFHGKGKIRGQLAEENSDGMFVLCARDAQIDGRSLYTLERRSGLNDGNVVVDASVIEPLRQIESLLISGHGVVENLLQSILTADLEIVLGETNLLGQALDFEIGGADLRTVLVFAHLVADLAPEVGRPGHINRERHERADSPGIGLRRIGEVTGRLRTAPGRADGDRRPVLRTRLGDQRAGFHEILKILFDVLVVDVEFFFQRVQIRVVENLPPLPAKRGILRAGNLPALGILEIHRGFLIVRRDWSGRGRRTVFRSDRTSLKEE